MKLQNCPLTTGPIIKVLPQEVSRVELETIFRDLWWVIPLIHSMSMSRFMILTALLLWVLMWTEMKMERLIPTICIVIRNRLLITLSALTLFLHTRTGLLLLRLTPISEIMSMTIIPHALSSFQTFGRTTSWQIVCPQLFTQVFHKHNI